MGLKTIDIEIRDIRFTEDHSVILDHCLYINQTSLQDYLMTDNRLLACQIELARPGESVRIVPVKDVIEPRAKLPGETFSGIGSDISPLGSGTTFSLKGCAVVTTGPLVGFQEGVIDMSGPLTMYSPFSKLNIIALTIKKKPEASVAEHEQLVRETGIRLAKFLAQLAFDSPADVETIREWPDIKQKNKQFPALFRVGYLCLCMAQGLLHDTYLYGRNMQLSVPTLISPLEIYDGALVSGNCVSPGSKTTSWHHQNNAVLTELLHHHGKTLNFLGVVVSPLMTTLADKHRHALMATNLLMLLGLDGVIISQEGFGNPTTDLMMICRRLEQHNIRTVLISNEDAGSDGFSEPLPDGVPEADAIISTGNSNALIELPAMERVIGDIQSIEKMTGGFVGSIQEDGRIVIEIHGIMGSHNLQGYNRLYARTV